jgi:hypothetical protein
LEMDEGERKVMKLFNILKTHPELSDKNTLTNDVIWVLFNTASMIVQAVNEKNLTTATIAHMNEVIKILGKMKYEKDDNDDIANNVIKLCRPSRDD